MSDLLLSVVVIATVVAFGALISVGNERQRRAIDALHQAYKQWAVQDLRLKRGSVSSQIQITDLTAWLAKVTSLAFGYKTIITDYQIHTNSIPCVEFHDGTRTVICALDAPSVLLTKLRKKNSALRRDLHSNPLFQVNKKTMAIELSMLNAGTMFDVELPVAWTILTSQVTETDTLWAYILD